DKSGSPDGASSITKTTAKLTWEAVADDPDLAELPVPGQRSRTLQRYHPVDGEITIEYSGRTVNKVSTCDVQDTQTFSVTQLPESARLNMLLTLGSDGTYQLDLNVFAVELQWNATAKCMMMKSKAYETKMLVGGHAFALGHQQGTIEYGVHGETKTPRT